MIGLINHKQQGRKCNPFNVITFAGGILLDPPSDNWSRTVYLDNYRVESTGNTWAEQANVINTTVASRYKRAYKELLISIMGQELMLKLINKH